MKKNCKKIMALLTAVLLLAVGFTMTASADVKTGMENAKNEAIGFIQWIATDIIAPLAFVVCVVFLIINLVGIFIAHREGNDYQRKVVGAALSGIGAALFGSFAAWGPMLFQR